MVVGLVVVSITSRCSDQSLAEKLEVGFSDVIKKLLQNALIELPTRLTKWSVR